ncbi:sigma factor-like helix-turn-helix DNA-binding protein [Streptomyces sp. NPDC002911]
MTRGEDLEKLRALPGASVHRNPGSESGPQSAAPADALAALEQLSPLERALLVLRDVFACTLPQIAAALGRSQEACRRLAATLPPAGHAWPRRIDGAENVARAFAATIPPLMRIGITLELQPVDGRPGVIFRDRYGEIRGALALDIVDGRIRTFCVVPGPEEPGEQQEK